MKGAEDPVRPQLALFAGGLDRNPPSSEVEKQARLDRDFAERFWPAYPRKVGKGDARESYRRAVKKKGWPGIDQALERLELQKESDRWRAGYIPNPATWLNQERWDDDPATMKNGNGKTKSWQDEPPPAWMDSRAHRSWYACTTRYERSMFLENERLGYGYSERQREAE